MIARTEAVDADHVRMLGAELARGARAAAEVGPLDDTARALLT